MGLRPGTSPAIAFAREVESRVPGLTTTAWKEERGGAVFIDYNQNARDRTIAAAYSAAASRPPGLHPADLGGAGGLADPRDFDIRTVPARFAELGDVHAAIDDRASSTTPLLEWFARQAGATCPTRPTTPRCPASRSGCSPARRATIPGE